MDRIEFTVNKKKCIVGYEVDSDVTINDYVRNYLNLRGTKYTCKQGVCGSCIVSVSCGDVYGHKRTFSVNSCLVSITQCEGWDITTIEGIGDRQGYHPIQKTLAEYNGSQCGYCSPGWVMSMYSLLEENHYKLTQHEIEDSFGSNTCRCTGFRPILDAFKSFASDAPHPKLLDIEDLTTCKNKSKCELDSSWCILKDNRKKENKRIVLKDDRIWYRVHEIQDVFEVFQREGVESYMLVNGNTGRGVAPIFAFPKILIDISPIDQLKTYYMDQNLVLGGGIALTDVMKIFEHVSKEHEDFSYLKKLNEHLNLVAHIPVRNIGTIAGNLMTKHRYPPFPSDVFLLLETVGATLTIASISDVVEVTPASFLLMDMTGKIITLIKIPPLSHNYRFVSFKIMSRAQNALAEVNAGFVYNLDTNDHETVISARIVIGGLSARFVHAAKTEEFLIGKKLFTNETLQDTLHILKDEIIIEEIQGSLSPEYRKKCALGLFYKGLLNIIPANKLKPLYRSGARDLRKTRPLSKGSQEYDTNPLVWPMNEPMPKVEALIQCSGESVYTNDTPTLPEEVYCAFATTEIAVGEIESIDASAALKIPGVITFLTAKDIPGSNNYSPLNIEGTAGPEEVLCDPFVKYYNQPMGIVVAESEKIANRAALLVKAKYKNVKEKPAFTINDVLEREPERVTVFIVYPARDRGINVQRVMKGCNNIFEQYHYHMENHSCVTSPSEDGINITVASHWPDQIHVGISQLLNINQNRINLTLPRLGGSYGGKISRPGMMACACALVTYLTNRPCRFIMTMQANLRIIGKRNPTTFLYEVGVSDTGEIQYLEYNLYTNNGYVVNDPINLFNISSVKNCYDNRRWQYKLFNVTTDIASTTYARSPGELEAIAMTEHIMERISYELDKDPFEVRLTNLNPQSADLTEMVDLIIKESEYNKRKEEVKEFNKLNRWKKRGLGIALMSWPASTEMDFHVVLTVYHGDGSIVIRHSGIDMGQGTNTKVIQCVAYVLQIPLTKVKVKPLEISAAPNSILTGSSRTSYSVCFAAIKCCQLILDRFSAVRDTLDNPTWELLVQTAYMAGINLQTSYRVNPNDQQTYRAQGVVVTEVELDILTGEHDISRVDLIQDVGFSINPELDVGYSACKDEAIRFVLHNMNSEDMERLLVSMMRVEGAFIMAVGYWTSENLIYNKKTGELLNDRALYYHVPLAKDIPIDFRVKLRRNSFNPLDTLGARANTEPPTCLGVSVAFALRAAIVSSREDVGHPRTEWFQVDGPFTLETNVLKADADLKQFLFY